MNVDDYGDDLPAFAPWVRLWGGRLYKGIWRWAWFEAVLFYDDGTYEPVEGVARRTSKGVWLEIKGKIYRKNGQRYSAPCYLPYSVKCRLEAEVYRQMTMGEGLPCR